MEENKDLIIKQKNIEISILNKQVSILKTLLNLDKNNREQRAILESLSLLKDIEQLKVQYSILKNKG